MIFEYSRYTVYVDFVCVTNLYNNGDHSLYTVNSCYLYLLHPKIAANSEEYSLDTFLILFIVQLLLYIKLKISQSKFSGTRKFTFEISVV